MENKNDQSRIYFTAYRGILEKTPCGQGYWSWPLFVQTMENLSHRHTAETHEEFMNMTDLQQRNIKDQLIPDPIKGVNYGSSNPNKAVGGFVAGEVRMDGDFAGRRVKDGVINRSGIILDLDDCDPGVPEKVVEDLKKSGLNYLVHATHKHMADKPRLRVIIPTSKSMDPAAYSIAVAVICKRFGINTNLDTCSRQHTRLMFWPSLCKDAPEFFEARIDGKSLDVDELMNNLTDDERQALMDEEDALAKKKDIAQGVFEPGKSPVDAPGVIGAWNRTKSTTETLDEYLTDVFVYEGDNRYTLAGHTWGGLTVLNDLQVFCHYPPERTKLGDGHAHSAYDLLLYGKFDGDRKATNDFCRKELKKLGVEFEEKNTEPVVSDFNHPFSSAFGEDYAKAYKDCMEKLAKSGLKEAQSSLEAV